MARQRVAAVEDVPPGTLKRVLLDETAICLIHTADGELYAIDDACSHEEQSLSEGEIWGVEIECPRHLSRFDFRTGEPTAPPALTPLRTYRVSKEGGDVVIDL